MKGRMSQCPVDSVCCHTNWRERFDEKFLIVNIGRDIFFNEISGKEIIKDFIQSEIDKAMQESYQCRLKDTAQKLLNCKYWLEHVYLNWGRTTHQDVKLDFARGYNLIAEMTFSRKIEPIEDGWRILNSEE